MTILVFSISAVVFVGVFVWCKLRAAHREIDALLKSNQQIQAQNEQLQAKNAVVETQVKHYQVKQKNEENSNNLSHSELVDRLHAEGDLRD